jgi:putative transposase
MGYDPEKHHRRSIRLKGYDYSQPGAYFVTMCLQGREPYLEIPEVCHIVEDIWRALPQRFPTVGLDEFILMPDHIHFILNLQPDHKHRPTLSTIVDAFKSLTARAVLSYLRTLGDICGNHFWQQRFYDHVISNETELYTIRTYIRNNPLNAGLLQMPI